MKRPARLTLLVLIGLLTGVGDRRAAADQVISPADVTPLTNSRQAGLLASGDGTLRQMPEPPIGWEAGPFRFTDAAQTGSSIQRLLPEVTDSALETSDPECGVPNQTAGARPITLFEREQSRPVSFVKDRCASCQQDDYCKEQLCPACTSSGWLDSLAWKKGPWQITPFGFLSGEFIASDASVTARAFVLYVNEGVGTSEPQFTVHGQTTQLGANFKGPTVGSLRAGGRVLFNFLGDRPVLNQSTPFLLRAYGDLTNEEWRFGFGVAPDIFGALTPETVNFGGNIQAGNIAAFRGQMRVERYIRLSDDILWTTMAALSQQVVSDFVANPLTVGTDNGWPNVEGRVVLAFGEPGSTDTAVQIGVAGVVGQTRSLGIAGRNVSDAWGVSVDGQVVYRQFGARCELFSGEAIGTYNAAIGQSLNPENGEAIAAAGGFGEVWCKPADCLTWHIGFGIDNPNDADLGRIVDPMLGPVAGQRSLNVVYWTNLMWNVTDNFELAFEVSRRETDYIAPSASNEAMIYHFRSRLSF